MSFLLYYISQGIIGGKMKFEECYRGFIWADMEKFYNEEKQRPDKRIKTFMGKDKNGNENKKGNKKGQKRKKLNENQPQKTTGNKKNRFEEPSRRFPKPEKPTGN